MPVGGDYKSGEWQICCDVCAFIIYASEARHRWDGRIVCKKCIEPRHVGDFMVGHGGRGGGSGNPVTTINSEVAGTEYFPDDSDLKDPLYVGGEIWDGEDSSLPSTCIDGNASASLIEHLVTYGFEVGDTGYSAMWTAITIETQEDTNGPLDDGGSRDAETPGFSTQDIVDSYITGSTLPSELVPTPQEHTDVSLKYLGSFVQGSTISGTNVASISLVELIYKQMTDWDLFRQHQSACFAAIAEATDSVTTPGVTAYYSDADIPLPALPASSFVDEVIGTYKTGYGSIELQRDAPLNMLVLRKYFQEGKTITKRTTTTYEWRADGVDSTTVRKTYVPSFQARIPYQTGGDTTVTPHLFDTPLIAFTSTGTEAQAHVLLRTAFTSAMPSQIVRNSDSTVYPNAGLAGATHSGSTPVGGGTISLDQAYTGTSRRFGHNTVSAIHPPIAPMNRYYQDTVETYTYIIGDPVTQDLGYADMEVTQTDLCYTTIQTVSDPDTILVYGITPISTTGSSNITFSEPGWEGEEQLRVITTTALNPFHLLSGTLGETVVGEVVTGAEEQLTSLGGCDLYGDDFI